MTSPASSSTLQPRDSEAGFSLIEVLVSLALIVLLLSLLPNAIGLGRRAWETHDDVTERLHQVATLQMLERHLAEALPIVERDAQGETSLAFRGEPAQLSFVAPSRSIIPAGLARFRLSASEPGSNRPIILSVEPFSPTPDAVDAARPRGMTRILGRLTLSYFGPTATGVPPDWQTEWTRTDALPALVGITLDVANGASSGPSRRIIVPLVLAAR